MKKHQNQGALRNKTVQKVKTKQNRTTIRDVLFNGTGSSATEWLPRINCSLHESEVNF